MVGFGSLAKNAFNNLVNVAQGKKTVKAVDIDTLGEARKVELESLFNNPSLAAARKVPLTVNIKEIDEAMQLGVLKRTDADAPTSTVKKVADDLDATVKSEKKVKQTAAEAQSRAAKFARNHAGLIILGLTAATLASIALEKTISLNGQKRNITSITTGDNGHKIVFEPSLFILADDTVTLTGTNSVSTIDGDGVDVLKHISEHSIETSTRDIALTTAGTTGTLTLNTSFENQLKRVLEDLVDTVTSPITDPLVDLWEKIGWIVILVILVCVLIVVLVCMKKVLSRKKSA